MENFLSRAVLFQSLESKTKTGGPVFNEIRWIPGLEKDIWMMRQSHEGLGLPKNEWDRLAIIVDKTATPPSALFLQLPPGELSWSENLKEKAIKNRVSCFMCHANGPRAIRPEETKFPLGAMDKVQLYILNRWIKNYGRIVEDPLHNLKDPLLEVPVRFRGSFENETLKMEICTSCHKEGKDKERGFLTRQNALSISFMINQGFMPPSRKLTDSEKEKIHKFILGF